VPGATRTQTPHGRHVGHGHREVPVHEFRLRRVAYAAPAFRRVNGAVEVEAGVELPGDRRLFLNLAVRAHLIPAKDVEHGGTVQLTLRPTWTHVAFLAGFGIHL